MNYQQMENREDFQPGAMETRVDFAPDSNWVPNIVRVRVPATCPGTEGWTYTFQASLSVDLGGYGSL